MTVTIEIKTVKLSEIKLNPDNPRRISKQKMEYLVKSIQDFPDMMQLREIVVDETMTILGGNMRYLALKQIGEKTCITKIVNGLTESQKREFAIKDNSFFGEWDFSALANEWSELPLIEWGIDLPGDWLKEVSGDPSDAEPQIDNISRQCLWQRNHPDKSKAQSLCKSNPEKVIVLYECSCESNNKKHNHHFDYSRAFEVINLCEKCHIIEHLRLRKFEEKN